MHAGDHYRLKEFLYWTRRDSYWLLAIAAIPTALHALLDLTWLAVPWVPVALVGTASAFIVGFKNNATYARLWEARQIWGAIVNTSRAFAMQVHDLVQAGAQLSESEAEAVKRQIVHRHLAWLTALRFQLRQPRPWETMNRPHNIEYRARMPPLAEIHGDLGTELKRLLTDDEHAHVMSKSNRATHLIALQSQQLAALAQRQVIDVHKLLTLEQRLVDLYDHQGKCERIKSFPYPRQFATINLFFVRLFVWLVPLGLLQEFEKLGEGMIWLTIPFSYLVGWVFNAMERVGESTENPFEGGANDVPITALCRTIEIDLRELLGERDIPAPLTPVNDILM